MFEDSIIPLFYMLGAAQGAFLAFALFTSVAGSRQANFFLGLYTMVFVVALIDYFLDITGITENYIYLRTLFWPKEFLYGILIYFYTRELTHPGEFTIRGKQLWHLVPAILHMLVTWPLLLLDKTTQYNVLSGTADNGLEGIWGLLLGDIELYLTIVHLTVYLLLSLRLVKKHQLRVVNNFSYKENVSLAWLRRLLLGTLLVYLAWLLEEFFNGEDPNGNGVLSVILGLSMVLLIYSMGYLGLRQPLIFSKASFGAEDKMNPVENSEELDAISTSSSQNLTAAANKNTKANTASFSPEKYINSPLSNELCASLMSELETSMEQEKLFLDNQLSLPQLAEHLKISVNYLSQAINQQKQQNFFDFINKYRVEETIKLFKNSSAQTETILSIALNSGFNSKSAFYSAFKKVTGMTPGQYRKELQ